MVDEGEWGVEHLPLTGTRRERMEWEALSLNVSRHPLYSYHTALEELGVTSSEEVKGLPHGTRTRTAGLLECLQSPPTKSGKPVWFLLIEDERGLSQATIFRPIYERYGDLLHHRGALLSEGTVENTPDKGFSFLVKRVEDLRGSWQGYRSRGRRRHRGLYPKPSGEAGGGRVSTARPYEDPGQAPCPGRRRINLLSFEENLKSGFPVVRRAYRSLAVDLLPYGDRGSP